MFIWGLIKYLKLFKNVTMFWMFAALHLIETAKMLDQKERVFVVMFSSNVERAFTVRPHWVCDVPLTGWTSSLLISPRFQGDYSLNLSTQIDDYCSGCCRGLRRRSKANSCLDSLRRGKPSAVMSPFAEESHFISEVSAVNRIIHLPRRLFRCCTHTRATRQ